MMNREITNKIRLILEDFFPPILRDSVLFKFIVRKITKNKTLEKLKSDILNISEKKYINLYRDLNRVHKNSDLSQICIDEILKNIKPNKILDVGCGEGFLLKKINEKFKRLSLTGIEMNTSKKMKKKLSNENIKLIDMKIENLDKIKHKYDTVICTHVLEHIFDINLAYENLKKICKKKLIIVVPRERAYKHTLNAHIHFFPYTWSFINTIRPKNKFIIKDLKRDLFYMESF